MNTKVGSLVLALLAGFSVLSPVVANIDQEKIRNAERILECIENDIDNDLWGSAIYAIGVFDSHDFEKSLHDLGESLKSLKRLRDLVSKVNGVVTELFEEVQQEDQHNENKNESLRFKCSCVEKLEEVKRNAHRIHNSRKERFGCESEAIKVCRRTNSVMLEVSRLIDRVNCEMVVYTAGITDANTLKLFNEEMKDISEKVNEITKRLEELDKENSRVEDRIGRLLKRKEELEERLEARRVARMEGARTSNGPRTKGRLSKFDQYCFPGSGCSTPVSCSPSATGSSSLYTTPDCLSSMTSLHTHTPSPSNPLLASERRRSRCGSNFIASIPFSFDDEETSTR